MTSDFQPKIGDFGFCVKVKNDPVWNFETCDKAGTKVYQPEEYKANGLLTKSVDTFAFGMILFELMTGQRPSDETQPKWLRGDQIKIDQRSKKFCFYDNKLASTETISS